MRAAALDDVELALTVLQPWASLIALGRKSIETRSWATRYRGRVAIHAGAKSLPTVLRGLPAAVAGELVGALEDQVHPAGWRTPTPLGAVIATADLVACTPVDQLDPDAWGERAFGDYSPGRYGWLLDRVRPLDAPVPAKGALKLWKLSSAIKGEGPS